MEDDFKLEPDEPSFDGWTTQELFYHLIDMHQIPYEEEFENWRLQRNDLLRWCKETYEHQI